MKQFRIHTALLLLTLLYAGCKPPVGGEGQLVKQSRDAGSFRKIELNFSARVTVIIADSTSVVVVAQRNLQEYIETKVEGETMVIGTSRMIKATKPVEIVMTCRPQEGLTVNGSGEIHVINPFKTENLNLEINGSGEIHANVHTRKTESDINGSGDLFLQGKSEIHSLEINGSGKLKAPEFSVEKYNIKINGSGDAEVHADSKLTVKLTGSGNIEYTGQPDIESEVIGSGELKKKNN